MTGVKGALIKEYNIIKGHMVGFEFKVDRLDITKSIFIPLRYKFGCRTTPSLWDIDLQYKRKIDYYSDDSYSFSVTLKRKDSSYIVKASLFVMFYDAFGNLVFHPMAYTATMGMDDEMEGTVDDIPPENIMKVVYIRVTIVIENCHLRIRLKGEPKFNADNGIINIKAVK